MYLHGPGGDRAAGRDPEKGRLGSVTTIETSVPLRLRGKLLVATAALAGVQLVHLLDVLRYVDEATFPEVLADPLAAVGIGAATAAFVALVTGRRSARLWVVWASSAVALGFVLHHAIPVELGTNNPYYTFADGTRADAFRWLTVLVLVGLGAWTAVRAWRADPQDLR
jgi:hypothetical protein